MRAPSLSMPRASDHPATPYPALVDRGAGEESADLHRATGYANADPQRDAAVQASAAGPVDRIAAQALPEAPAPQPCHVSPAVDEEPSRTGAAAQQALADRGLVFSAAMLRPRIENCPLRRA